MRVFWLVNVKLPIIYKEQNKSNQTFVGGWLDRISQGLMDKTECSLMVCYPYNCDESGTKNNLQYKSLNYDATKMRLGTLNEKHGVTSAMEILKAYNPDIIHIHGTEFQFSWFFAEAAQRLDMAGRLVISIQGMVGPYSRHLKLGLPQKVLTDRTVREIVNKTSTEDIIDQYRVRGEYEKLALRITHHIIGRTSWDRACTIRINPDAEYHIGNEILRENFYTGQWDKGTCCRHRIFISQATYSIKGFHIFVESLADIKKFFPDVTVHVAGTKLIPGNKIKGDSYASYIDKLMVKYDVSDCIYFCGSLSAEEMKKEMLEANVFVSPSTIENSPNSVGEAMLLGVPIVSSNVGGVSDLLKDKEEGYLYQSDAPYMLAYYVMEVFRDSSRAMKMSQSAKRHAMKTHDYRKNLQDLIDIYEEIVKDN